MGIFYLKILSGLVVYEITIVTNLVAIPAFWKKLQEQSLGEKKKKSVSY